MPSHIVLHNLSSSIRMEDNRWIVTVMLIAFPCLVSQRLGEETAGGVGRKEERKKARKERKKETSTSLHTLTVLLYVTFPCLSAHSLCPHQPNSSASVLLPLCFFFFKPHCLISDPVHDSSAFVENTLFLFPISTTLISITLRYRLYREQVASCLGSVPRASILLQFLIQHFFYCSFIFEEKMAPLVIRLVRYQRG